MMRSSSPTHSARSTSSNLIRSYTTSSDLPASEQLAAIAKAREERRKQREVFTFQGTADGDTENIEEIVHLQKMEEKGHQETTNDSSTTNSLEMTTSLPKLRVQPTSDRSFTPSIPSSPSKSSEGPVGSTPATTKEDEITTPRPSSPLRNSFELPEIPPFRPPSASPTNSSPRSTPPPSNVVLSGGLLDRLKAQRAAQVAKSNSESGSPAPSGYGSEEATSNGSTANKDVENGSASSESVNEASIVEPPDTIPRSLEQISRSARPPSTANSFPESLPPLTSTSTNPSSLISPSEDADEGGDAVSDLSEVFINRERGKSRSRIHGRYGEEVEYDFTALSDVQERSERSSMSTMQGSLWRGQFRQNSLPLSETASSNRQNSTSNSSFVHAPSPVAHSRSSPSLASTSSQNGHLLDRRVDATSQLIGRSTSVPSSIFDNATGSRSSPSTDPSKKVSRPRSPVRNTSPEIARRASRFELPSSPTKLASPTSDIFPLTSSPIEPPLPALLFEDSLAEIVKRRVARRARLDSIRNLYTKPPLDGTESKEKTYDAGDAWNEIERKEREQVDGDVSGQGPPAVTRITGLVAPFTPPVSPIIDTFCEGYLSVPVDEEDQVPSLQAEDWISRYSVLTSETLSFRPTDQNSLTEPIVVLKLVECDRVEECLSTSSIGGPQRPFSVLLKSGQRKVFGCEKGSERVRWVLAIENAIRKLRSNESAVLKVDKPQQSARRLIASPLSQSPSTRSSFGSQVDPIPVAALSQSARDVQPTEEPRQLARSIWSRPEVPSSSPLGVTPPTVNKSQVLGVGATSPVVKPLSVDLLSRFDERPLPKVPTSPQVRPHGHSRSRSDLSAYRTRDEEPPFRPSPTRPKSLHTRSKTEEYLAASVHSDRSSHSGSSLTYQELPPSTARPASISTVSRAFDAETVTTRGGLDTASSRAEWQRALDGYKHEACQFARTSSSPLVESKRNSGSTSRHYLQSPTRGESTAEAGAPIGKSGFRLAFGRKAVSSSRTQNGAGQSSTLPRADPFVKSATVQPNLPTQAGRFSSSSSGIESSSSETRSQSSNPDGIAELLCTIRETLENQQSSYKDDKACQEMQAQAISALAHWVTEDTRIRQSQHDALGRAVEDVVHQVANLPHQVLAALENAVLPETDNIEATSDREEPGLLEADEQEATMEENDAALQSASNERRLKKKNSRRGLIINPLSSFATAARTRTAQIGDTAGKPTTVKPKGPRMPGIRVWGAPEPVADRSTRWGGGGGGGGGALDSSTERAVGDDVDALRVADRAGLIPSSGELYNDDGQAELGREDNVNSTDLSGTISEILNTLKDLAQRQADQAISTAEERPKSQALTAAERAELEAKKTEIARIKQVTSMNAERTAKINDMVAQLARKANSTEQLLTDIAKSVKEGKTTTMDPALTAEVKKLLGGVQSGVNSHVADFRGQLTSEVQRMFKEVGKLRDEKKALQNEIAELMAFHAKYSGVGTMPKPPTAPVTRDEPVLPTQDLPAKTKVSSFYGPRIMK
ncbi:hypothetical protein JCM3765_006983 [Sporobolomyces pararoseus]